MKSALQCSKTEAAKLRIRVRQLEEKIVAVADASELEAAALRAGADVLITENARLVATLRRLLNAVTTSPGPTETADAVNAARGLIVDAPRGAK